MDQVIGEREFWGSISILLRNYHGINKNVFATKKICCYRICNEIPNINLFTRFNDYSGNENIEHSLMEIGCQIRQCTEDYLSESVKERQSENGLLFVTKILSKNSNAVGNWYNLQLIDYGRKTFFNIPLAHGLPSNYPYLVKFVDSKIIASSLELQNSDVEAIAKWCEFVLHPKLTKWALFFNENSKSMQSLCLLDVEDYNCLYANLKQKYGKKIVEIWPESTDPLKHVYEDIAIASYLILLWKTLSKTPKNFVDIGCGNGLLVHILNSEGYPGFGIDIRRRKIWDIYPKSTHLQEKAVIPNEYQSFVDVDWIIGNHSDELSPWIPVIAARASYNTSYFLLPCCAYEFNGRKYQRRDCKYSVYNDFLNYVTRISDECGFVTQMDRLKIPSMKRVALIGSDRTYSEAEYKDICTDIDRFVSYETRNSQVKLRDKIEVVRNCTKIDKRVTDSIVLQIFNYLIEGDVKTNDEWRKGKTLLISDIVKILPKENLNEIKKENGGLKTLLKNNHSIFEVNGDYVKLRVPKKVTGKEGTGTKFKQRECFFYFNHPDRCPLNDEDCSFKHKIGM